MKHQFTISPNGMITILPDGRVIIDHKRAPAAGRDYSRKPVQVAVRQDLSIEIHGANFSATADLSPGDALGLISMLAYSLRERGFIGRA
jgi:hypothetical protein